MKNIIERIYSNLSSTGAQLSLNVREDLQSEFLK